MRNPKTSYPHITCVLTCRWRKLSGYTALNGGVFPNARGPLNLSQHPCTGRQWHVPEDMAMAYLSEWRLRTAPMPGRLAGLSTGGAWLSGVTGAVGVVGV